MNWKFGRKRSWPNSKVISRHSSGRTEKNHENLSQESVAGAKNWTGTYRIRSSSFNHSTTMFGGCTCCNYILYLGISITFVKNSNFNENRTVIDILHEGLHTFCVGCKWVGNFSYRIFSLGVPAAQPRKEIPGEIIRDDVTTETNKIQTPAQSSLTADSSGVVGSNREGQVLANVLQLLRNLYIT
jgi:hypothetical protein